MRETVGTPPAEVRERVEAFAREHAAISPGLLAGVVVTGSAIAGDWWPGVSDVDLVLVVRRPLVADDIAPLARLHASTISKGPVDGVYLTEAQLAAGPERTPRAPQVVEGALHPDLAGAQLSWVTWREVETGHELLLRDGGASWRPSQRRFPGSRAGVRRFSARNLGDYWRPFGRTVGGQMDGRPDTDAVSTTTLLWVALGPPRLVASLEAGEVFSKSAAAAIAADRWPGYADLLHRAVAARQGAATGFTVADARRSLELLEECCRAGDSGV